MHGVDVATSAARGPAETDGFDDRPTLTATITTIGPPTLPAAIGAL